MMMLGARVQGDVVLDGEGVRWGVGVVVAVVGGGIVLCGEGVGCVGCLGWRRGNLEVSLWEGFGGVVS